MKYIKVNLSIIVLSLIICIACDPPGSSKNSNLPESKSNAEAEADVQELQKKSDDFDKSIENLNDAMDLAKLLNEKIQIVEKNYASGEISRKRADGLITTLNEQFGKQISFDEEEDLADLFPEWLKELGFSEPIGLVYNTNNSFQTREANVSEGFNSILFVYKGSYKLALNEARRIAKEANIPMSENYQKVQELSKKLGKEIEGLKGMTYMNYRFDKKNDGQKYHISINVDEHGKLTLKVVDEISKSARSNSGNFQ